MARSPPLVDAEGGERLARERRRPGEEHVAAYTVVVANGRAYGAGLQVAPGAAVDDGRLDVIVIGAFPRRGFPRLLGELRTGEHLARAEVAALRGRTVTVAADRPLHARADGEARAALPVTACVRPGVLRVRSGPVAG